MLKKFRRSGASLHGNQKEVSNNAEGERKEKEKEGQRESVASSGNEGSRYRSGKAALPMDGGEA